MLVMPGAYSALYNRFRETMPGAPYLLCILMMVISQLICARVGAVAMGDTEPRRGKEPEPEPEPESKPEPEPEPRPEPAPEPEPEPETEREPGLEPEPEPEREPEPELDADESIIAG